MTDLVNEAAPAAATNDTAAAETPTPTMADTMGAVFDKLNPPRENGRFVAKDAAEPPAEGAEPAAEAVETDSTDQPAKAAPEPAQPAIDAPHSWSAEEKAEWASVPPKAQAIMARREMEAHRQITRAGEQIKQFEPIRNVVDRFAGSFQRNGLQPADGIARMLAMEDWLARDAHGAITEIAKAYGVDLSGAPPAPQDQTITELRNELAQIKGHLTSQQREAHEAQQADLARAITAASKDLAHFEEVKPIVAGLISSGAVPEGAVNDMIKAAYDMAVHASPTIRERIQADQRKANEAKAKEEAEKKAAEARKAASLNVKSNSGSAPAKPVSIRATMEAVADRAGLT